MEIVKSQIRPRQKRIRFSNADLLALDTTGLVSLIGQTGSGAFFEEHVPNCIVVVDNLEIITRIVTDYDNIDNMAFISFFDPINFLATVSEDESGAITALLRNGPGVTLAKVLPLDPIADDPDVFADIGFTDTDMQTIIDDYVFAMTFDNGGADLTDGDPLNFMDLIISYRWVKVQ